MANSRATWRDVEESLWGLWVTSRVKEEGCIEGLTEKFGDGILGYQLFLGLPFPLR
jgi:hypothetical protein